MSELLDERVVEMRFDNADFERNVGQSIKTINRLKESLDFEDAGSSFDSLAESASKVDFTPIEKSIDEISVKFNMLEIVAAHVLGNIVSKAVDAGAKLAKSVSVDQISAGWSKYEQKTSSVQTIIAATGESIDTVNKKLEKLIWFADETSYDFVDMVNNIGKFTSAGVDLDVAVNSMMGISNWAALSGAGIQQASRAMYNLSQSIGMGYVAVQDWKSIELANMATQEFKETAIAMALELGTLKEINGEITTLDGKVKVTSETMRESLKGKWFTSDVLNETLGIYSDIANKVKEFQELHPGFETVSRALEEMAKTGFINLEDPIEALGYRAFVAAQEAKTLTEAINATKDAVSSGWMRTFELIFGNYDQAKKLWTNLANDMYDIFAAPGEARNEKLADVMKSNYQKLVDEMPDPDEFNNTLYNKLLEYTKENRGEALAAEIFSKYDSLEDLLKNEDVFGSELKKAFTEIADDNTSEIKRLESLSKNLKEKQISLRQAAIRLATDQYGAEEEKARKEVEKIGFDYDELAQYAQAWQNGIEIDWDAEQKAFEKNLDARVTALHDFNKQIKQVLPLKDFFNELTELGGRDKLIGGLENLMSFFKNFYLLLLEIGNGFSSLFGGGSFLSKAINGFYELSQVLGIAGSAFEQLQDITYYLFHEGLPNFWDRFLHGYDVQQINSEVSETGEILDNVSKSVEHIPGLVDRLSAMYEEHLAQLPEEVQKTITNITGKVSGFINSIPQKYEELQTKLLGEEQEITLINLNDNTVETKTERIGGLINELRGKIESFGDGIIPKTLNGISKFLNKIIDFFFTANEQGEESKSRIQWIFDKVSAFINLLKTIGKSVKDIFGTVFEDVKTFFAGGKYSFSEATIWALPDQLKKHFEDFKNSKAFQDVKAFFFGKDINTTTFGQSFHIAGLFDKVGNAINNFAPALDKIKSIFLGDYFEDGFGSFKTFLLGSEEEMSYFQYQLERLNGTDWFKKTKDFLFGVKDNKAPNGALNSFLTFFHTAEEYEKANIFGKIKLALQDLQVYLFGWKDANSTREFEGKLTPIIEKIKLLGALMNDFRKKIGLSWVKVTGEDDSEYWERQVGYIDTIWAKIKLIAAGIANFGKKVAGVANDFRKWLGLDWDLVTAEDGTTTLERIPGFIDTVAKKLKSFSSSPAVVAVKEFFFGNKTKGNLFVRIRDDLNGLIQKQGFVDFGEFLFGSEDKGIDNLFTRLKNRLHDFFVGNEAKGIDNFLVRTKNTLHDFFLGNETKGIDNLFIRFKNGFKELITKSGYANLHDFIFGNETLKQDNIVVRFLDSISNKFDELKNKFPWLNDICDFLVRQIEKIRNLAKNIGFSIHDFLFGHDKFNSETFSIEPVDGIIDKIQKFVSSFKDIDIFKKNNKENKKSFLERIADFFTGTAKTLQRISVVPKILRNIIGPLAAISVLLLGFSATGLGGFEISSPLANLVDTLQDFVKSVAIIVGLIVGLSVYLRFLDAKGWGMFVLAAAIISGIMAGLFLIAKSINGSGKESGVIESFRDAAAMYFMISFIRTIATLTAVLAGAIIALSLVSKLVGPDVVFTAALSVALVIAAVGFSIKMMNDSFEKSKDTTGKLHTHAGELFGIALILFNIGLVLSTIVAAFSWLYFLTKGKSIKDLQTPLLILGGILVSIGIFIGMITGVTVVLSSLKAIPKSAVVALISLEAFVLVMMRLAVALSKSKNVNWQLIAVTFGGIAIMLGAMVGCMVVLSNIPKLNWAALGYLAAMIGIVGLLGVLVVAIAKLQDIAKITDYKSILPMLAAIGEIAIAILGLSVIVAALGKVGELTKGIDLGTIFAILGKVGAVVGVVTAVVLALGAILYGLDQLGDGGKATEIITGAGEMLEIMFSSLGKAFGGLIGGIGEGISDSLPAIATNISDFIDNLSGFLEKVSGLTEAHLKGAGIFSALVVAIGAGEILLALPALSDLFTGDSIASVGTTMSELATNLSGFLLKIGTLNESHLTGAAIFAGIMIAIGVGEIITAFSSLLQNVVGGDFAAVGTNMTNLITNLSGFLIKITTLSDAHVAGAGFFTQVIAKIGAQTVIGFLTALMQNILGDDFTKIGTNMTDLITNMTGFLNKVKSIDESHVKGAENLGKVLRTMGGTLVKAALDNLVAFFIGDTNFTDLTTAMKTLAEGTVTFGTTLTGTNLTTVEEGIAIVKALLDLVTDDQYKSGGISGFFSDLISGTIKFDDLFKILNDDIADNFVTFSNKVAGANIENAKKAAEVLPLIFDMLSDDNYRMGGITGFFKDLVIGDAETSFDNMFKLLLGDGDKKGLISGLSSLSVQLNAFSPEELDLEKITKAIGTMQALFDLMSFDPMNLVGEQTAMQFGSDYIFVDTAERILNALAFIREKIVTELKNFQTDIENADIDTSVVQNVIDTYTGLVSVLTDLSSLETNGINAEQFGTFIIDGLVNALNEGKARVQIAAEGVAEAVKNGLTLTLQIQSPSKVAYQIGQFVAQGLYNGLRAGLPMNEKMASILGAETVKSLNNGMSKHTINMVKEDLLDENLFNMPDFSFINDLGMEDIDFDKMRSFLQEKFGEVLDPNMIDGFVGQFKMEWNKIPKVINNTDYAKLMTDIAKGEYGLGENEILENLTEHFSDEADAAGMAAKAINDYNKVLDGSLTINKDLLKQQKQNPPMTYEQYMEMIEHEQEGIKLANEGFFDKMAAANGTSREEEMKNWGYDPKITQNALDQMTMNSKEVYDTWEKMVADKELAEEESKLLQEWEQYVLGISETTTDTTKKISHYDQLEAKSLNTLLKKISEEKGVLTDADIELMKHLQQATVTEGMFGTDENGQRKELLKNFGIAEEYIDLAHDIGSAANVDEFIDQNAKIKRASDQSTEALEKQSEAAEKAEKAYSNLNPEMKSVWDNIEKAADEALKNGADSIHLDTSIFSGLDENVQKELSEALGTDGFDISFGKLGLQVVDDKGKTVNIKNGKDFQKYFGDKIDAKKLTSMIFESRGMTSVFGNLGNLDEQNMDWLEFGKTFFEGFTGKESKETLSIITDLVSCLFSIEKSTDTINKSELEMHADTSEVSAADAYVQSLLDKYKLSESEVLKVKQGYSNLVTDGTITKQQQEALEKFFNGVVIGTYGSIDKAREYMTETFGIDWDKFLTYHGQGLDTFTSSAMEYSKTVKDLINDENKYTTTNLMHDIEAGKWGEGLDRKKAFEAANIDYKKAMELYALWQKQGDEALKGYAANYGILTDEEAAAAKQQEAFNEALATTPEGAFKSIGDFLKSVNQVLEDSSTASNFTNFINDIIEPLKTVNLENAPAFEQVSNFIKMVRSVSNGKTGTEDDFGSYIQRIADAINTVEINTEQFKPIADFLTGLNKLGETASETVAPFTKFISSVIELPEGDISVKATEASMVIVTRIIEVFEEHYDRFTEIGRSIVMRICAGIISMRAYAAETAATLSTTFLSTFQEQAVNKATELGKDFTSGLIEGLGSEETKTALKDAIGMLFGMPAEGAEGMAGAEAGMMTSLGKTFGQTFGTDFISGFGETVSGQTETLQTQLAPIITGLTSATEAFTSIEDPGAAITNFVDGIGQASEESLDSEALTNIQTMAETIKGIISSSVPDGYGMGFAFVEGLYLGLMDGYAQYGPAIAAMTSSMGASAVSSLGDGMEAHSPSRATMRLGGYFVEGFAIGIQNTAREAYHAAYDLGDTVLEGTKDSLGIHSPSDVAEEEIGKNYVWGAVNGIWQWIPLAKEASTELGNTLLTGTRDALANASTYDYFDPLLAQLDMEKAALVERMKVARSGNDSYSQAMRKQFVESQGQSFRDAVDKVGSISQDYSKRLQKTWSEMMLGINGWAGVFGSDRDARLLEEFGITWADLYKLTNGSSNLNLDSLVGQSTVADVDALTKSLTGLKDFVNEIWKGTFGVGHANRKAAAEALGYDYDVVKEYVSAVQGDASSIDWTKAEEKAKTGGKNITQGLADGIKSKMGAAKEAATAASAKVSETVKSFFKMDSPSKLFIEFGGFLDEGLAIGISENTALVTDNIESLSDVITSTFNESVINLADLVEADMNTEPVIRPVIDMSDVTESASRIDSMLSHEQAVAISTTQNAEKLQNGEPDTSLGAVYNFTQNNYSPKALSRLEIYRQTRNQFAMLKGGNAS